jgi:hypothetical protein
MVGSIAAIFLLLLTDASIGQSPAMQEMAKIMRSILPAEAKCQWASGAPICYYNVQLPDGGNASLSFQGDSVSSPGLITVSLSGRPLGSDLQNKQEQMMFAFLEKMGFPDDLVKDCFSRGREGKEAEVVRGSKIGTCASLIDASRGSFSLHFNIRNSNRF